MRVDIRTDAQVNEGISKPYDMSKGGTLKMTVMRLKIEEHAQIRLVYNSIHLLLIVLIFFWQYF